MEDFLVKRCGGVMQMEVVSSLSPSKRRKLDSHHSHISSPEFSLSLSSPPPPSLPPTTDVLKVDNSSTSLSDPNKGAQGLETDLSVFIIKAFSKEATPSNGGMEFPEATKKKTSMPVNTQRKTSAVAVMPSDEEIEEFFSVAEKYEKKRFAEKYNYDIVKDVPLEGRYEWVELKP